MEILPRSKQERTQRIGLLITFLLEIIVLIFLSTLAYYLRIGTKFPLRRTLFSPVDTSISFSRDQGNDAMQSFDFNAYVSKDIIVILTFCLPIAIILIFEVVGFRRFQRERLTLVITCFSCRFAVVVRRIIRFIGVFLTGVLITMIFIDVTKFMVAQPRPRFLEVCQFNQSACSYDNTTDLRLSLCDPVIACTNEDKEELARARKSFPSFHASITSYSAVFLFLYLHKFLTRDSNLRVLGSLLSFSFVAMSLLCCLMRFSLYLNHWIDLLVGFIWGAAVAFYMTIFVLKNFDEESGLFEMRRPSLQHLDWQDLSNGARMNTLPTIQTNLSTRDINNINDSNTNISSNINNNNNNFTSNNTNNPYNHNSNQINAGNLKPGNSKENSFQKQASKISNYSFGFNEIIANETKRLENENNKYNKNQTNNNFKSNRSYNNNNNVISNNNNPEHNSNFSLYRHRSKDNLEISDYY